MTCYKWAEGSTWLWPSAHFKITQPLNQKQNSVANFFYSSEKSFKKGSGQEPKKIGGIEKGAKIRRLREELEKAEDIFMNISFKKNRSEKQREERKNKR